jgi:hypothetical protein
LSRDGPFEGANVFSKGKNGSVRKMGVPKWRALSGLLQVFHIQKKSEPEK